MDDKALNQITEETADEILDHSIAAVKGGKGKNKAKKNRRHVVNRCDDLEARAGALDEQAAALGAATTDLLSIAERAERERLDIRDRARKLRDRVIALEAGATFNATDRFPKYDADTAAAIRTCRDLVERVEFLERGLWARIRAAVVGWIK